MSKKKQPPRMPVKKEPEIVKLPEKKKPVKAIVIAVAALLLVAAIVIAVVFAVKPSDNNKETTAPTGSNASVESGYEYVDYKGVSMAKPFVDILTQAEADRKNACKEYGTAVTVGDIDISYPEFLANYYDQHSLKKQDVQLSIEKNGMNMTGYDPEVMPDEQPCLNRGYTWAEEFTRDAIVTLQDEYSCFDKAIEEKITFTDDEVTQLISEYNRIEMYSQVQNKTYEELFADVYTEGYTEAMFKAREIRLAYNQKYRQHAKQEIAEGYSDKMLKEELEKDPTAYTVVKGRIYPIEGEYNAVEASKVSNEQEFLDYATANYPKEGFVAETRTLCNYVNKETISSTYGPEVGEWMFSRDRVPGEIAVVEGQIFKYLVYVEEPSYFSVSKKIMYFGYEYFEGITEAEVESYRNEIDTLYNDWKAGGEKKDAFAELCLEFNGIENIDARAGDFFYAFDEWIHDDARKTGDHTAIEIEGVGYVAFYFIEENKDDFDWKETMKTRLSENEYLELYKTDIEKNYEAKRRDNVIKKAQKEVNETITRMIEKEKANG
ncbi:MAG: hypothetical protein IJD78_08280 [Clostridia bacterium]|nr:hypothetical protein [Clostridia bacterium]